MTTVDNFKAISALLPENFDGDTFWYTELLDRSKRSGNNSGRRVGTFYHRSRAEFVSQIYAIRTECDFHEVRAYFRPTPRSFREVGVAFTRHVVEQALTDNWEGMRHGYSHVCGVTPKRGQKVWLWDVDSTDEQLSAPFKDLPELVATVPSRKGYHFLTRPFNLNGFDARGAALHKDNPTNLYIPDDAA